MPNSLSKKYQELQEKMVNYLDDRSNEPDPAVNPKAFVEYHSQYREVKRNTNYLDDLVENTLTDDEKCAVVKIYYEENDLNQIMNEKWEDTRLLYYLKKNLFIRFPELENELSDDDRKNFDKTIKYSEVLVKRFIASGKIKEEELNKIYQLVLFGSLLPQRDSRLEIVRIIEGTISKEKMDTLINGAQEYKTINSLKLEEQISHPYSNRIRELKENVPEPIASDPIRLNEYTEALNYADSHLTLVNEEVKNEKDEYEHSIESIESKYTKKLYADNKDTYQGGLFKDLYQETEYGIKKIKYISSEKNDNFGKLINGKIELSQDTKDGLRRMLHLMEEMNLSSYAYDKTGEDGEKVYGQCKLLRDKTELIKAIKKGEPEEIINAQKKFKKTWEQMEELYSIAKASFSQDNTLFPGNVDGTRNAHLSWEFTNDVMTTAQVNTVFLIYMNLKNSGKSIDEYVENPIKDFYKDIEKKALPYTFVGMSKGLNFSDTLDLLLESGEYKDAYSRLTNSNAAPAMGVGRSAMGPSFIEKDPEKRDEKIVFCEEFKSVWENAMALNNAKCGYLEELKSGAQLERKLETLKNLLIASDQDRNTNAMLAGLPETDLFGRTIGESFKWKDYLNTHPADYTGIIQRFNILKEKSRELHENYEDDNPIRLDYCIEAMNDIAKNVLIKNVADRNTEEYRQLENEFLSLYYELAEDANAEIRVKLETSRNEYLLALRQAAPKDFLENVTAAVSQAKVGVHGGSGEYDDAEKALLNLSREYKILMDFGRHTPQERRQMQLESVRNLMIESAEKIQEYLNRKEKQKRKGKRLNGKSIKRMNTMRRSLDALQELFYIVNEKEIQLNADENIEEGLPLREEGAGKTKEQLLEELKKAQFEDPDFETFMQRLEDLNNEMASLMKADENGWKEIDKEILSQLYGKYKATGSALELVIRKLKNSGDENSVFIRETCKNISAIMSRDMEEIGSYNPDKGMKTLPTILENSRTETLEINKKALKTVSGSQSVRIPMSIVDGDGNVKTGFFTKATYFDPVNELRGIMAESASKASTPEGAMMLRGLLDNYFQFMENKNAMYDDGVDNSKEFIRFILSENYQAGEISSNKLMDLIKTVYGKTEKEVKKLCGSKAIDALKKNLEDHTIPILINAGNGIGEKSRTDVRNVGMSIVADLLGTPGLICRSRTMKLKSQDGSVIDGTFMEEAVGKDPRFPGSLHFAPTSRCLSGGTCMGLKLLADLQVIDYICGNCDRNYSNMFFDFDEYGNLITVQGIDNESAFGSKESHVNGYNKMVAPSDMLVMSREMADKILELKPGHLIFSLRGRLEEKAIDNVIIRLNNLKEDIKKSREYYRTNPHRIKNGHICEISDKDWKRVNISELTAGEGTNNIFTNAALGIQVMRTTSGRARQYSASEVGNLNRATEGGLINEQEKVVSLIKELGDSGIKSGELYGAAKQYQKVLSNIQKRVHADHAKVKDGDMSPESIFGQFVGKADLLKIKDSVAELYKASENYYNSLTAELQGRKPDKRTAAKLAASQNVKKMAKLSMVLSADEQERTLISGRQASEQMLKVIRKQESKQKNTGRNNDKGLKRLSTK